MVELKRVLLVEGNMQDVELTLNAFAENNLANEVVVGRDGEEALDYLYCRGAFKMRSPGHPAVVLLDLKLPRIDGLEVLKQIKADPGLKPIPVVMLTSSREEQDLVQSHNLGVNAYVVKPVDFRDFVAVIKQLGLFLGIVNQPPPGSIYRPSGVVRSLFMNQSPPERGAGQ